MNYTKSKSAETNSRITGHKLPDWIEHAVGISKVHLLAACASDVVLAVGMPLDMPNLHAQFFGTGSQGALATPNDGP